MGKNSLIEVNDVKREYNMGETVVRALRGINISINKIYLLHLRLEVRLIMYPLTRWIIPTILKLEKNPAHPGLFKP